MPPITLKQALTAGMQHHQAGDFAAAENIYRQVLSQVPAHPDALHLYGVLAHQTHRRDLAEKLLRSAVVASPRHAAFYRDLGNVLIDQGKFDDARVALEASLALEPGSAIGHNMLGVALARLKHYQQAIINFQQSLALAPEFFDPLIHLGNLLLDMGNPGQAADLFSKAASLKPDSPAAWTNLAIALSTVGNHPQAQSAAVRALALDPTNVSAYVPLSNSLKAQGDLHGAENALLKALTLSPDYALARNNLANLHKDNGDLFKAIEQLKIALNHQPQATEVHSNLLLTLQYLPEHTLERDKAERDQWASRHATGLSVKPAPMPSAPLDRIRIGFVSPDLYFHPVGRFLLPLLSCLDRTRFFVACYSDSSTQDDLSSQLRSHADLWVDSANLSHDQLDQRVRSDNIHILIDLAAHTAGNRMLVFARKPAPVQVTWLAYNGSTGLPTIDFRFSDPHMDPPGLFEGYFSEKTLRLPRTYWCYSPPPLSIDPKPRDTTQPLTFGCLNNFCKVSPPALECWIQLLKSVPDSRLILHAAEGSGRGRIQKIFQNSNLDPNRVQFQGRQTLENYYNSHNHIDIALDPFPFNGGITSLDALWMGVPLITLKGDRPVGRAGTSILTNLGLDEFIASTPQEYLQIATHLALNPEKRAILRQTLRNRLQTSPLMNAQQFAADFAHLLEQVWSGMHGG